MILLEGGGRAYVPARDLPAGIAAGHLVEVTVSRIDAPPGAVGAEEIAALIERIRSGGHTHG